MSNAPWFHTMVLLNNYIWKNFSQEQLLNFLPVKVTVFNSNKKSVTVLTYYLNINSKISILKRMRAILMLSKFNDLFYNEEIFIWTALLLLSQIAFTFKYSC